MGVFSKKEALNAKPSDVPVSSGAPATPPSNNMPPMPTSNLANSGASNIAAPSAAAKPKLELPPLPADLMVGTVQSQSRNVSSATQNNIPPQNNIRASGYPVNPDASTRAMPLFGGIPPEAPPVRNATPSNPNAGNAGYDNNLSAAQYSTPSSMHGTPDFPPIDIRSSLDLDPAQKDLRRRISTVKGPVFISLDRYREVKDLLHSLRENSRGLRAKVEELKDNKSTGNDLLKSTVDNLEKIEEEIENINSTLRV